jgi:plastocyanin domain-containing protein
MTSRIKISAFGLLSVGILIVLALTISGGGSTPLTLEAFPVNNVSIVDGKQLVVIRARGGYRPEKSIARAGIPTVLRFETNGTFDCSSSVRIPSMDISKNLPPTGVTDVDIGASQLGVLGVTCGMGMYSFEVDFRDS